MLLLFGIAFAAVAQQQPYLLLQGPTKAKTYRFMKGQSLEWRLQGEEEFFSARINELYPESQSIRIDDMILSMGKIAEVRHRRRGAGVRGYLQGQGIAALVFIGGFSAFPSEDRDRQTNFLISAAVVSAAMIVVGSVDKNASREFGPNSKYVLKIAGGDLRKGDNGERQ
ncbi:MAG: hypothetical protein AB8F78_12200 [Saprospiraceae bacterium]